jgi:hypothetical protein
VGRSGALGALDRGWEAAATAVDGEPRLRRGSGEVESSGKRKAVEMWVWECKSGFVGSSRTCSRSRRRHGCAGAAAGKLAVRVAAQRRRRDVEERGEGQRGPGSGGAGAGAARGAEESDARQQVLSTWPARAAGVGQRRKQSRGLEVDEGDLVVISQKCRDSIIKPS